MPNELKLKRFHNLDAPLKMTVAFTVVLAAIVAMGAVLFVNLTTLARADVQTEKTHRALHAVEAARFNLARQENSLRGFLLTQEPYYAGRIETLHRPGFLSAVDELEALSTGDPEGRARVDRLKLAFAQWRLEAADKALALGADPATAQQAQAMIGEATEADRLMGQAEAVLGEIEQVSHMALATQSAEKARAAEIMRLALVAGIGLTAAIAAVMGLTLLRSTADPVVALTEVMQKLAAGDHAVSVPFRSRQDEVGRMAGALATFQQAAIAKAVLEEEAEAQRREAQELARQAQAASRAKSEFLTTMTHELRTPLNGILGMAQVMGRGDLAPDQRSRLDTIEESGRALLGVINDILDISKIEAGRLEIRPAPFDLDRFAADLDALYSPLVTDKGLAFTLSAGAGAHGWFEGDALRLRQLASNLISNALKFTDAGEVAVHIDVDGGRLTFAVTDTGVGVPADQQEGLFERFVQADASATRRHGGTGLGLAICKELVALMGGTIGFSSREGEGSRFAFEVPLAAAAAPADVPDSTATLAADQATSVPRVLVADDNPTNRRVLLTLLEQFGVAGHGVTDGCEAVEAWENGFWDAILMDIHMPRMDGVSATLRIREREQELGRARTPIIAVTASALTHETEAYATAGMDGCVAKPIEVRTMMTALQAALGA